MNPGFARAVGARVFATGSALVAGLVSLKLYGKYLEPELYGVVLVALQIMAYLPLLDGGFRTATNRRILAQADEGEKRRLIDFCQSFYSWLALIVFVAALLLMVGYGFTIQSHGDGVSRPFGIEAGVAEEPGDMQAQLDQPLSFFFALGVVGAFSVVASAQIALLIGLQAQTISHLLAGLNAWTIVLVMWRGLASGLGLWAFPLSSASGALLTYLIGLFMIRRLVPGIRIWWFNTNRQFVADFRRLRGEAWACFRSQIVILILFSVDVVLVGFICGTKEAAIYGVLTRIFGIMRAFVQASGEAAWPVVAQRSDWNREFNAFLVRFNGWIYGSLTGAACATLPEFLNWYMGEAWEPPLLLVYLIGARFLITGQASTVAYFLYGMGEFSVLTRFLQRELAAALVLSIALAPAFGMEGISGAFLLATLAGTFFPILQSYARQVDQSGSAFFAQMWWRAALGMLSSWLVAGYYLKAGFEDGHAVIGGAAGFSAGIFVGLSVSFLRVRRSNLIQVVKSI